MNNVIGKMLVVMQLVFSILFMCFAGAVYTFQGQWRNKAVQLEKDLEVARKQTEDITASRNQEKDDYIAQIKTLTDERDQLRAERGSYQEQAESAQEMLAAAQLERDKALGDSEVASTEAAARVVEASVLSREVQTLTNRQAQVFRELQDLQDQLLSVNGKLASAEEKEAQHLAENARLKDLLRSNKIDPRSQPTGPLLAEKDKVDGFVERTMRNKARTTEFVEITIGSDDKVFENMKLIISRGADYICQARVVRVNPDTAICVVDEETRQGIVQRGDNVTTKL
ncbi:MAG: hypothetical protein R3C49_26040 [Planctomycetaceae bacterium]